MINKNSEIMDVNLNLYEYFMEHLVFNNNESYVNISPIFLPIVFTKIIPIDLFVYSLQEFELLLQTNSEYINTSD
jgi:hypothetical protein